MKNLLLLLILIGCTTFTPISELEFKDFELKLKAEDYIRGFDPQGLPEIKGDNHLAISLSYLLRNWPVKQKTSIAQIAIRTNALYNLSLNIRANKGFKIKKIYGFDDKIKLVGNENIRLNFKALKNNDWRIVLVEMWGKPGRGTIVPLDVTALYGRKRISAQRESLAWQQNIIAFSNLNTDIALNSILYANALTLIEVSRLYNQENYVEADRILTIQLNNIRMFKKWQKDNPFQEEEERLYSIKKVLNQYIPAKRQVAMYRAKTTAEICRQSLKLSRDVAPGPWSLIASLFGSLFFK